MRLSRLALAVFAGALIKCTAFTGPTHPRRRVLGARRGRLPMSVDPNWLTHTFTVISDSEAVNTVAETAKQGDWFAGFVELIESAITLCDQTLESVTGQKAYGFAIILFTLFVKAITYPLTYTQLASSTKMQAIQPKVKEIQKKYQSNPEVMNREMALLYQQNEINPLAGCLPALVQIPIFIALYRALLKLASDGKLDEGFLWLPNLEGPVYGAQNSDWLFKNWDGFTPPLGWHDTLCFLSLPIILVVTQSISQRLLQPPQTQSSDPSQAASQQILQYLPLMVGFFALNVPSGLAVYWIVNNLFSTTATLVIIKPGELGGSSGSAVSQSQNLPPESSASSFADLVTESQDSSQQEAFRDANDESDPSLETKSMATLKEVEGFAPRDVPTEDPTQAPKAKKGPKSKKRSSKKSRR